jgi:GNAT superfamily N-acetyltransferase
MAAYRFCRTDDIALLVDALNRCWSPYFPGEPPMTPASFKRSIRDLQVWCSSCMVAFSGADPIGVLIGAKRPSSTLIHKIAVHPDHRRLGHAGHLLDSLSSKLAILGPPRIVAEVPDTLAPACELFNASGYVKEAVLTDYVMQDVAQDAREAVGTFDDGRSGDGDHDGRFVIPITIDDLAANGLAGEADPRVCWTRSIETLTARKDNIAGLAIASDERIEAYVLFVPCDGSTTATGTGTATATATANAAASMRATPTAIATAPTAAVSTAEIVSLRSFVEDGGARLKHLLSRLHAHGMSRFKLPKVHPAEISKELLESLGFQPAEGHLLYAVRAR